VFAGFAAGGNAFLRRVVTSAHALARAGSEERQQLLLQAAGLGHGALLTQLARTQDHRVEVALEIEDALEALTQLVRAEGKGRTLVHGLAG